MDLSQAKHAFVTGGASGIGLAIARALAARGVNVTIADILPDLLQKAIAEQGDEFFGVELDVRDREGWASARAKAEAVFGPVHILVNNAGIGPDGRDFADMNPESFDTILDIDLVGVANGVFAIAGSMRERGFGHIVNTASIAGLYTQKGLGAYTVAKLAVVGLSESLRQELAGHGVGVSVLCPNFVPTGLAENTARVGGELPQRPRKLPKTSVTAENVAEMVMDGIERNADYIVTHSGNWPEIEKRMEAIRQACTYPQSN